MTNQTVLLKAWQWFRDIINHIGWNGLSCFITGLSALGLGGFLLANIFGLYNHLKDFYVWVLSSVEIPRILIIGGVLVIFALIFTTIHTFFSNRHNAKLESPAISAFKDTHKFDPSPLHIEIMMQLAAANEIGYHWVELSAISDKQNLSENRAHYFLKILKKHNIVHQHMIDGGWGIKDDGIDYLIEHNFI